MALRKLSHGTWTTVSLASVDSVEVLLEWHKDLSEGDDLDSFRDFAKRASSNATARVGTKGQGKGKGKAKHDKSANGGIKFQDSLISHVNTCISRMLGDNTGRQLDGWKTSGHNLRADIIRVVVRLPKTEALNWLGKGTAHRAILARDIADFPEATDLRKVWIAPGCPVLDGNPVQISQSLHLYLADCKFPWAIVRAPFFLGGLGRLTKTMKEKSKALCSRTLFLYRRAMLSFALTMYRTHLTLPCWLPVNIFI